MKSKRLLKPLALLLIGIVIVGPILPALMADEPLAEWNGRYYSAPVCDNPNCPMCYGPNGIATQLTTQRSAVNVSTVQDDEFEYVTKYRAETVQRCNGLRGFRRRCWTETIQVPYTVKVPKRKPINLLEAIEKPKSKLSPTPQDALVDLFVHLGPIMGRQTLIDAGAGDGRVIEEATRAGFTAIGVEINGELVDEVRKRFDNLKIGAEIVKGDALKFDYSGADVIYIYQYTDFAKEILEAVDRSRDRKIVSYMHELPGVENVEVFKTKGHEFFIGTLKAKPKTAKASSALDLSVLTFTISIDGGDAQDVKVNEPFLAKGKRYAIKELKPAASAEPGPSRTATSPRVSRSVTRTTQRPNSTRTVECSNCNQRPAVLFPIARRVFFGR